MRRPMSRRTIDHLSPGVQLLKDRVLRPELRSRVTTVVSSDANIKELLPPSAYPMQPTCAATLLPPQHPSIAFCSASRRRASAALLAGGVGAEVKVSLLLRRSSICSRFVHMSASKDRCPVHVRRGLALRKTAPPPSCTTTLLRRPAASCVSSFQIRQTVRTAPFFSPRQRPRAPPRRRAMPSRTQQCVRDGISMHHLALLWQAVCWTPGARRCLSGNTSGSLPCKAPSPFRWHSDS